VHDRRNERTKKKRLEEHQRFEGQRLEVGASKVLGRPRNNQSCFANFKHAENPHTFARFFILHEHTRNAHVLNLSTGGLVTISKNNWRWITWGIRPVWEISSLAFYPLLVIQIHIHIGVIT